MPSDDVHEITEAELEEAKRYAMRLDWDEEDRIFVVSVDEIPGLHTHGRTREEAVEMGAEAIATWLAGLREFGRPVPTPCHTVRRVVVARPPGFDPTTVRAIRDRLGMSQAVFAAALNVSRETVRAWEQGKNAPGGSASRLLEFAARSPRSFRRLARSKVAQDTPTADKARPTTGRRARSAARSRPRPGTASAEPATPPTDRLQAAG